MHGLSTSHEGESFSLSVFLLFLRFLQDRSLGSVELRVADIARTNEDIRCPYASTGKKSAAEPIRLDRGNVYKGTLHYVAEFVPAIALKNIGFDSEPNELQQIVDNVDGHTTDDEGSVVPAAENLNDGLPNGPIPASNHTKVGNANSSGRSSIINGISANEEKERKNAAQEDRGINMSRTELFRHRTY